MSTILGNSLAQDDNQQASNAAQGAGIIAGVGGASSAIQDGSIISGAGSALTTALPITVLMSLYSGYRGYRQAKKASGGGALSSQEIQQISDPTGVGGIIDRATPQEVRPFVQAGTAIFRPDVVAGQLFGSGKSDEQLMRDRWRKGLEGINLAINTDRGHFIELADGSMYNIGLDGQNKLPTLEGGEMHPYDVDQSNPLTQQAIGFMNPLGAMLAGGSEQMLSGQGTGYFTNASLANADNIKGVQNNAKFFYEKTFGEAAKQTGVSTEEMALGSLQSLYDLGKINEHEFLAYSNGIRQLYGHASLTPPGTPIEQDPAQPQGAYNSDPSQGFSNNTATAGVVLDQPVNTLGNEHPDRMPTVGNHDNLVPTIQNQVQESVVVPQDVLSTQVPQPSIADNPNIVLRSAQVPGLVASKEELGIAPSAPQQPTSTPTSYEQQAALAASVRADAQAAQADAQAAAEAAQKKSILTNLIMQQQGKIDSIIGQSTAVPASRDRFAQSANNLTSILGA